MRMKLTHLRCAIVLVLASLTSIKTGRACNYGGVTCNTFLGTACDGACDGDVCEGTQMNEYSCTDGSVQFIQE